MSDIAKATKYVKEYYGLTRYDRMQKLYAKLKTFDVVKANIKILKMYKTYTDKENTFITNAINTYNRVNKNIIRNESNKIQKKQNNKYANEFLQSIYNASDAPARGIRIKYPTMEFKNIKKYVHHIIKEEKKPFTLTLTSTKADISYTWKFYCKFHFDNWIEKILENRTDSGGNGYYMVEGIFEGRVIIKKLSCLSGGCNKHAGGSKSMKSSFYNYKLLTLAL